MSRSRSAAKTVMSSSEHQRRVLSRPYDVTPSPSRPDISPSPSPSASETPSPSPSDSGSPTPSPSDSGSPSPSPSDSSSPTANPSPSATGCPHQPPCRVRPCLPPDRLDRPPGPLWPDKSDRVPTPPPAEERPWRGRLRRANRQDRLVRQRDARSRHDRRQAQEHGAHDRRLEPLFARSFISRLNGFVGEWVQAAGTLQRVLDDDAPDLINVARRYRDAHDQAEAAVDKINK